VNRYQTQLVKILCACLFLLSTVASISVAHRLEAAEDGRFPVVSNLRAGVAKVDITPTETEGVMVTGHRRMVHGVRDPLRAGVLILDDGETKVAIVTLDTIFAWNDLVALVRPRIEQATGVPASNILVAASHNHSAPAFEPDSAWGRSLVDKLTTAATQAAQQM
jgi:neutral ceramidase